MRNLKTLKKQDSATPFWEKAEIDKFENIITGTGHDRDVRTQQQQIVK
jgi:hypothetical protein